MRIIRVRIAWALDLELGFWYIALGILASLGMIDYE
jgi:hypothetical protein